MSTSSLYTLEVTYVKRFVDSTTLDLSVVQKGPGTIEGLALPMFSSTFKSKSEKKDGHSYTIDSSTSDLFLLDVLSGLHSNGWKSLVSCRTSCV